jgi:hypothetical protein
MVIIFFLCFLMFLVVGNLLAQVDVQNTGILFVSSTSDTVFMGGSFTNASGSALTNNSVVNIKQNITNNEVGMATGTGTLYLNGASTQILSGTQTFKTNNLNTNNAAGFTLNNNLSASGLHTFTSGLITTSATPNYMVYEAGASYTGDADSRHVNGWVKKIGNTNFSFPVGNGTYERTVALTTLTAASEFNVRHNPPTTPNFASLFTPLVLLDTDEYWTINKISGGAAIVTINWDNAKIPMLQVSLSSVKATYYDGTFWTSIGGTATGNVATTGSIASTSVSAFNNNFTMGSSSWVLPVQLVSFTAQQLSGYNKINWVVTNEINVTNYSLQRSDDGINFYTISLQNASNANTTALYNYSDAVKMNGKVYYRLAYLQYNGATKYSGIISIMPDQPKGFYVIKNPVSDKIEIYAGSQFKGKYTYTLTNSSGQIMQSGIVNITAEGIYTVNLQAYISKGIYRLVLQNEEHQLQKNILKD